LAGWKHLADKKKAPYPAKNNAPHQQGPEKSVWPMGGHAKPDVEGGANSGIEEMKEGG